MQLQPAYGEIVQKTKSKGISNIIFVANEELIERYRKVREYYNTKKQCLLL
jgi:hypothetical protein